MSATDLEVLRFWGAAIGLFLCGISWWGNGEVLFWGTQFTIKRSRHPAIFAGFVGCFIDAASILAIIGLYKALMDDMG
ncbi:MAG TPA: hypothetical protein VHL34_12675 [Rhizomicrobium sp.]|nr:hypothetical protein [Rhizomicrobium sp.]